MRIDSVLAPIDFSPVSTVALNCAIAWARRFRANLTILHVRESRDPDADQVNLKLSGLVAPEDQDDLNMHALTMHGKVQEQILDSIRERRPDLVVMGTGSTTYGLLRRTNVSMVTVNAESRCLTFHRFLFATDLSAESNAVLQAVLDVAQTAKADVAVLHSVEVGLLQGTTPMGAYITPEYMEDARAKLDDVVSKAAERHVSIEPILTEGTPAQMILKTAEENDASLIVIATAHKGLLERALLGSTAERVIRKSRIPVLSIPKHMHSDVGKRAA
jgi:nucleotide-binding universal stress UspA family protein